MFGLLFLKYDFTLFLLFITGSISCLLIGLVYKKEEVYVQVILSSVGQKIIKINKNQKSVVEKFIKKLAVYRHKELSK